MPAHRVLIERSVIDELLELEQRGALVLSTESLESIQCAVEMADREYDQANAHNAEQRLKS